MGILPCVADGRNAFLAREKPVVTIFSGRMFLRYAGFCFFAGSVCLAGVLRRF